MSDSEKGYARQHWWSVLLLSAATFLVAACVPLTPVAREGDDAVKKAPIMVQSSDGSQVEVQQTEGTTVLDVTSESGIGSADVTGAYQNADSLSLRLHLNGLEEFRFAYGSTEVLASVSSNGDHQVRQSVVTEGGAQEAITPDSPYWLTIEARTSTGEPALSIPLEDGYFDVTLPDHFTDNPPEEFTFAWIDFYR